MFLVKIFVVYKYIINIFIKNKRENSFLSLKKELFCQKSKLLRKPFIKVNVNNKLSVNNLNNKNIMGFLDRQKFYKKLEKS